MSARNETTKQVPECVSPAWDLMLSYRRKAYGSVVLSLADLAQEASLECWLDLRNIDQGVRLSKEELRRSLRYAAEHSRIVVGFADRDALARDPNSPREPRPVFNWRLYEHQFAREFVWVDGSFLCSFPNVRIPFFNLPHLAYYLALACGTRSGLEAFWNRHLAGLTSVVRHGVYLVAKYHSMPTDFLPPILHPALSEVRKNAMSEGILNREEIDADHDFETFE